MRIAGAVVGVRDAPAVRERWRSVIGGLPGVEVVSDPEESGLVEVRIAGAGAGREPFTAAGVRFVFEP